MSVTCWEHMVLPPSLYSSNSFYKNLVWIIYMYSRKQILLLLFAANLFPLFLLLLLLLSRFSRVRVCATPRRQPTRLPHPWDSPVKNTGVGCHFLLQCMKMKNESEVTQLCVTLRDPMDCSLPGSSVHGIFQARVLEWAAIAFSSTISTYFLTLSPYKRSDFLDI